VVQSDNTTEPCGQVYELGLKGLPAADTEVRPGVHPGWGEHW
jgi:hypothetical protein